MEPLNASGVDMVERWANSVVLPRLVLIDTLGKVSQERGEKQTQYSADYQAIAKLQRFAGERGLAVILVHHTRKMEASDPLEKVSGTLGLTGSADTVMVLDRGSKGDVLYARGRDIEEIEKAIQFNPGSHRWSIIGNADEVRLGENKRRIIEALREEGGQMTPKQIGTATQINENTVRSLIKRLSAEGLIIKQPDNRYMAIPDILLTGNTYNTPNRQNG